MLNYPVKCFVVVVHDVRCNINTTYHYFQLVPPATTPTVTLALNRERNTSSRHSTFPVMSPTTTLPMTTTSHKSESSGRR